MEECSLYHDKVNFLGYLISSKGTTMDGVNIETILDRQMTQFVHYNYYWSSRFIQMTCFLRSSLSPLLSNNSNYDMLL